MSTYKKCSFFNYKKEKLRILIIALSGIGDALMFTPALFELKKAEPESQIDALVMFAGVKDIMKRMESISNIHYFDFIHSDPFSALRFVFKLRHKYDAVINVYPSNRKEYNIINFIIGAKKRIAVRYNHQDKINFGFLNNITIYENDSLHNVEENINLITKFTKEKTDKILPLQFVLNKDDRKFADDYLITKSVSNEEFIISFHPGCSTLKNHINRRWEPEKFVELGRKLIEEFNAKIFVFGGPDETRLKNKIVNGIASDDAISIDTKSLFQTAALMERCKIFVTNDSSLMHIASALQLNIVSIIGPTNLNYIHPWQTNYKVASLNLECSPCFYYSPRPLTCSRNDIKFKCIKNLQVDMVFQKVKEFIDE